MELTVSLSNGDGDDITTCITGEDAWTLDVIEDLLRRAGNEVVNVHHRLHPVDDGAA